MTAKPKSPETLTSAFKLPLMLPVLFALTLTACASKPPESPPPRVVEQSKLQPLPPTARQVKDEPLCSPTCSDAVSLRLRSWQSLLTGQD